MCRHGIRESVAPRRPDRRECLARHADGIDDDVVDRDVGEAKTTQDAERLSADAEVDAHRVARLSRAPTPEVIGVEPPRLEMDHQIVFDDQVQPAAAPRDAGELANDAVGMGNRLQHVPAHDQVERSVRQFQLEDAAVLEARAVAEHRTADARPFEVIVDDVDAEQARTPEQAGKAHGDLARAAAGIEDVRLVGQPVAREERLLLWPDGFRLRGEIADHRLVRHLLSLRIQWIDHPGILSPTALSTRTRCPPSQSASTDRPR